MTVALSELRFAIRTDEPYRLGHHHIILPDGSVAYTDHKSLASYAEERGGTYKILSDAEFDALLIETENALVTKPEPISKEQFWYFLECLPPCRWHHERGVELFHVSERLTGDLVQWCAQIGGNYYGWTDQARRSSKELSALVAQAHGSKEAMA